MNHKLLSAAIVALAGTSAALAAPRETFDAVALNGGPMIANHTIAGNAAGSAPSNSVTSFAATGGYAARAVRVVGTVGSWGAGTYGSETVVRVTAPSGEFVDFRPSSLNATPAGDVAFDLQANLVPATTTGTWTVMTYETLDDGSVDSTYSALSVTIDDANTPPPPFTAPFTDLGDLAASAQSVDTTINLATASEVRWFKATLPGVSAGGAGYVDMWTTPTANPVPALDMTDTGVSMYAAATGALVTYDDDDGPGLHAQMSYGSTTSRGTTTFGTLTAGVALDGRDGALAGGDYYIAVSRYLMTAPAVGYNVTSSSTSTQRNTVLHIRTQPNSQPTNPVLSGPAATLDAGQITFTINVTGGQNPDSTDLAVTIDLQSFGGAQGTTMTGPGGTPGTYTITFAAPAGASDFTAFPFTVHASDSQGRSAADVTLNFVGLGTVGWDETANGAADSGDMMASAQVPTGNGALNVITGAWTAGDNADVYKIQICDFANFIASTQYSPGGPDTQLFLFNEQGMGVSSNDDNPSGAQGLTSALDATGLTADGIYYLAVSRYDLDPVDASAAAIFLDTPFNTVHTPDGPGAANPWDHFDAGGTAGNYRLSLQGVCYAPSTPTQCSPADVGVQGGAFGHDRRLDNNDFISFITLFFAQDPAADVGIQGGTGGSDNAWDNNDFIAFISYFFNDSANCNG